MKPISLTLGRGMLALFALCLPLSLCFAWQTNAPRNNEKTLDEIRTLTLMGGRAETEKAAQMLRELSQKDLSMEDHDTYVRLSRDVALRLGDREKLQALRNKEQKNY